MSLADHYDVREWFGVVQEIERIGDQRAAEPLLKAAVGVVIRNPFAGREFQADLSSLTDPSAALGLELGRRAVALVGGRPIEGYGKGGLAGLDGEQEHVVACVTTIFGDAFREAIGGGKAWISSATKIASAGTSLDIPLAYKDEVYVRSHYDAITLTIPDAPRADELVLAVAVSTGSRINARVGGLAADEVRARS